MEIEGHDGAFLYPHCHRHLLNQEFTRFWAVLSFFCPPSSPFSQHSILRLFPLVFTFTIPSVIFLFLFVGICATSTFQSLWQSQCKSSSLYFFSLIYAVWSLPPVTALLDKGVPGLECQTGRLLVSSAKGCEKNFWNPIYFRLKILIWVT